MRPSRTIPILLLVLLLLPPIGAHGRAAGPQLRLVASSARELIFELNLPVPTLAEVEFEGDTYAELDLPGFAHTAPPGHPDLPILARLLAAPPGGEVELEVETGRYVELRDVLLAPASDPDRAARSPDPAAYAVDAFLPAVRAESEMLGSLRGVQTRALRLFPFSYNPARRILRLYPQMRIRVRFTGGARPRLSAGARRDPFSFDAFLNPQQAAAWATPGRAPKPLADDWYDPSLTWVKIYVEEDGLYRIDPDWLRRYVDPESVDPRSLRLFHLGQEQAIYVEGEEDGRFEESDYLLFHGLFRRDDRDFPSLYGPRDIYWLTWGGPPGKRFTERSGEPTAGYPELPSFWDTTHLEIDAEYDPLPSAPDDERDHWFWFRVDGTSPTRPGSGTFVGDLPPVDLDEAYQAHLRLSLHGVTNLGHHTVVKLNTLYTAADTIWGGRGTGQTGLLIDTAVPSSALRDGRNRLIIQAYADQDKFDYVYMNWFELDYRRRFVAVDGYLRARLTGAGNRRITISGLRDRQIELFDLEREIRFTDLRIDSSGTGLQATFEDAAPSAAYVLGDSHSLKTPRGVLDTLSLWHQNGRADYLIITHQALREEAERLAEHRRAAGFEVEVVGADDIYDEFSYGRTDRRAIAAFISHAYHSWEIRPSYVLLLGDDTYDYRGLMGTGVPLSLPSLYYQSRGRGHAPSDFLYSLVDGDDLLPDLAIGRLPVSDHQEARQTVDKLIRYDSDPEPGDWRTRAIYLANYHEKAIFTASSDSLAARYTEPLGLTSVRVYNPDDSPIPNPTGRIFLDAFDAGALLLNFNGHGSAGTLQYVFSLNLPDWGYLDRVHNGGRLPLVLAFSCLNGMFVNPIIEGLAEVFTTREEGGAIAYISATAKSYVAQNDLLGDLLYARLFAPDPAPFGPALDAAKVQLLAAHSSWVDAALTMQLFGDPAQRLALPSGPDYAVEELRVDPDPPVGHTAATVHALLKNRGIRTADSLDVLLIARPQESGAADTLLATALPPFGGLDSLAIAWPLGERRGAHRLELTLDPENRLDGADEGDNRRILDLDILAPRRAEPIFPISGGAVEAARLQLEAAVPLQGGPFDGLFALSTDPTFGPEQTQLSPPVDAVDGLLSYRPEGLLEQTPYFWRVLLQTPEGAGLWSEARSFQIAPAPGDAWQQRGVQLMDAAATGIILDDGRLALSPEPLPFRPSSATREDGFTVRGLDGAGVLATDGKYVYAKRWYNDASTVYPGIDRFTRVGTGFADIYRTGHFGLLADSTTAGISATYHSDGYIYSESGKARYLERLSVATGRLDTVAVPDGLLEWKTGTVRDGHSLITSDGRYIYNVSMSSAKGIRAEWGVRVFDPDADWSLVREFTSPPTENGFTYEWTDGILADGQRLYFIEYGGRRRIRMVDAFDGRFLDEWTSDQDTTRIVSGQYDWVNNKVWLGDLLGNAIFRYAGLGQVDSASLLSEPIGPASSWKNLRLEGEGELTTDLLVEGESGWTPHPGLVGLPAGRDIDLSALDPLQYPRIRLRAHLSGGPEGARMDGWSVDLTPRPSLRLERAEGQEEEGRLRVDLQLRNLSPFAVADAFLTLERSDRLEPFHTLRLPPLERGQSRSILVDSLEIPPLGVRLFARLQSGRPDADPTDDRLEIPLFFGGRAPLLLHLWPEDRPFLDGDPLRPGQGLILSAPGVAGARLQMAIDGTSIGADSLLASSPEEGPRLLLRPELEPGDHLLEVLLFREGEELGRGEFRFRLTDELVVANPLVYPHPVRDTAAFTCVLSREARVTVEIYALSGRLIRRLGPEDLPSGFQQIPWDGRDASGRRLAGGTYLYLIRAADGDREVLSRNPLAVVR